MKNNRSIMFKGMFKGFSQKIHVLFFAKMILAAGNFVFPFLTIYLSSKHAMSSDQIGLFLLLTSAFCIAGSVIGGHLADAISNKKVLVSFLVLSAICYILVALSNNTYVSCTLLMLSIAFISGAEPGFSALTANITSRRQHKDVFSFIYLGQNIGFAIGPLIASFLFTKNIMLFFLGDAIATIIAAILIMVYIKEAPKQPKSEETPQKKSKPALLDFFKILAQRPLILIFGIVYTVYPFIYSQVNFSLPLFLQETFGTTSGPRYFAYCMTLNGLGVIILTPLISYLTKKNTSLSNLTIGGLFYAFGFGLYAFMDKNLWIFFVAVLFWTVGEIINIPNSKVFIAENSHLSNRARMNVMLDLSYEAGFGLGPAGMGRYIKFYGLKSAWSLIFFVGVCTSFIFSVMAQLHNKYVVNRKLQKLYPSISYKFFT